MRPTFEKGVRFVEAKRAFSILLKGPKGRRAKRSGGLASLRPTLAKGVRFVEAKRSCFCMVHGAHRKVGKTLGSWFNGLQPSIGFELLM